MCARAVFGWVEDERATPVNCGSFSVKWETGLFTSPPHNLLRQAGRRNSPLLLCLIKSSFGKNFSQPVPCYRFITMVSEVTFDLLKLMCHSLLRLCKLKDGRRGGCMWVIIGHVYSYPEKQTRQRYNWKWTMVENARDAGVLPSAGWCPKGTPAMCASQVVVWKVNRLRWHRPCVKTFKYADWEAFHAQMGNLAQAEG